MKRVTILLLAVAFMAAVAGNLSAQGLSFGIKGGINMAKYSGSDAGSNDMKMGAVGGAFACVNLIVLKVQPELLFSQKGAKKEQTVNGTTYTYSATLNYVEVPVLLKYSFGAVIVPSVYVGPSFGMLISAKAKTTGGSSNTGSGDIKSYLNGTDIGLVVGAEVKTPMKLSVEARYTLGLTHLEKASAIGQSNIKNSTISLMLGYYLF